MGLLEKILNKKIREKEKTYTKSELQSLFKKAMHTLSDSDDNNTEKDKKKKHNFDFAIKKIKKNKKKLSAPLDVFNLFIESFELTKGSLFILNQASENFTVWALTGYDYTTANRLRIPDHDVKNIFSEEKKPFRLNADSFKKIKKYFSSREFANLESIILIPFFTNNGELFAFLMFSHTNDDTTFSDILNCYDTFYHSINDSLLHFFDTIKISSNTAIFIQHNKAYSAIEKAVKQNGYSNPFIAFFNINKFLDSVSDIINKNFKNNLYNNIIDLLSSFASSNGNIFIIDKHRISILKDAPALNDKEMIAYQISFFLSNLIPQPLSNQASTRHDKALDEQKIKNLIEVFHLPKENDTLKQFLNG